jgi:hypothetical protein
MQTFILTPQMQTLQTTAQARPCAPSRTPADVAALLARFGLSLAGLLTDDNAKLAKGSAQALPVILHHLPHKALAAALTPETAGIPSRAFIPALRALAEAEGLLAQGLARQGCPWATPGCAMGCLNWAGHGGLSGAVAAARGRRTLALLAEPATYQRALLWAVARHWAKAQALGLPLAVRLRGTDDHPHHLARFSLSPLEAQALARKFGPPVTPGDGLNLAQALAVPLAEGSLALYDYSKAPLQGRTGLLAQRAAGWDVTASLAADRGSAVADAMAAALAGFRLAAPVMLAKGQAWPVALRLTCQGQTVTLPAIAGDNSDNRWLEPQGVAVILRTKVSKGADRAIADPFSLAPVPGPQALPDGTAELIWA